MMIWNHLQKMAEQDEVFAEKLKDEKHSMSGCMEFIMGEARKQATNGCAMIEDSVVYGWAVHYYDEEVKEPEVKTQVTITANKSANEPERAKKAPQCDKKAEKVKSIAAKEKAAQNEPKQSNGEPEEKKFIQLSLF